MRKIIRLTRLAVDKKMAFPDPERVRECGKRLNQRTPEASLTAKRVHLLVLVCATVLTIFFGCSTTQKSMDEPPGEIRYSLIYVIHGDANYTYHLNGQRRRADVDVLNRAIHTAQKATHGEVFIFHQKPERKLLFLIPQKDRLFYHFRNGKLVGGDSYSPNGSGLKAEAKLYKANHSAIADRKIFLYFGHEIPTGTRTFSYHQSQPYYLFNTEIFSNTLSLFEDHFELVVLSTCNNGNPVMVDELTGLTDYLVASPQNLHLSHLSDKSLHRLETHPDLSAEELANSVAKQSFEKLSAFLQTAVTVAVYDLHQTGAFTDSLARKYREHLQDTSQTSLFVDNTDCQALPVFDAPLPDRGITLYFKPAAFGRISSVGNHSGWGCKE